MESDASADEAERLLAQRATIQDELLRLETDRADIDAQLARLDGIRRRQGARGGPTGPSTDRRRVSMGQRRLVLAGLELLGWCAYARELALFCAAWFGQPMPMSDLTALGRTEQRKYRGSEDGPASIWLCPAVTHDRFEPIGRLWTRSDWPLTSRIVAPYSSRVAHLHITARLCELAASPGAADRERLRVLAVDHARGVPGIRVAWGTFDPDPWRAGALDALARLAPADAVLREAAAERLRARPEIEQLFGIPAQSEDADVPEVTPWA